MLTTLKVCDDLAYRLLAHRQVTLTLACHVDAQVEHPVITSVQRPIFLVIWRKLRTSTGGMI